MTKNPLLRMLRCDSVAPFGKPVVPEVYWMLIGSVTDRLANRSAKSCALTPVAASRQPVPVVGAQEQHLGRVSAPPAGPAPPSLT